MNSKRIFIALSAIVITLSTSFALAQQKTPQSEPVNFFAQGYQAEWVSQTPGNIDADHFSAKPGDVVTFKATFKNTGQKVWKNSGDEAVTISIFKDLNVKTAPLFTGFDDPNNTETFGQSFFKHSSWRSKYNIASIAETEVKPGETGTFSLSLQVPSNAPKASYREDISLAAGKLWMKNTKNGDPLKVAHIWIGIETDIPQTTSDAENKIITDSIVNTLTNVKRVKIDQKFSVELLGDLAKLNLLAYKDKLNVNSILLYLFQLNFSGKVDYVKEDAQFDWNLNIGYKHNNIEKNSYIKATIIRIAADKTMYLKINDYDLSILDDLAFIYPEAKAYKTEAEYYLSELKQTWLKEIGSSYGDALQPLFIPTKSAEKYTQYPFLKWDGNDSLQADTQGFKDHYLTIDNELFAKFMYHQFYETQTSYNSEESIQKNLNDTYKKIKTFGIHIWTDKDNFVRKSALSLLYPVPEENYSLLFKQEGTLNEINIPFTINTPSSSITAEELTKKVTSKHPPTATPSRAIPVTIEDIVIGTGAVTAQDKRVTVNYTGTLANGKKFDSTFDENRGPFTFTMGKGNVIEGWEIGLTGMRVGGKRKLTIPPEYAYGKKGYPPVIPENATLFFEIELLKVE